MPTGKPCADINEVAEAIALLYKAALHPESWPRFLESFARVLGGQTALIWLYDYAHADAQMEASGEFVPCSIGFTPEHLDSFARHYAKTNVWAPLTEVIPEGQPVVSSEIYPEANLAKTEYYNDWLRPQGLRYALGGAAHNQGSRSLRITTLREEVRGPFAPQALAIHRILMPHIKRAYALHREMRAIRNGMDHAFAALDLVATPVWLLGSDKRLYFANEAGKVLDQRHDGVWLGPDGGIRVNSAALQQQIDHAIGLALGINVRQSAGCCGDIPIPRSGGNGPLLLSVYPLRSQSAFGTAAVAVFISDPTTRPAMRIDALRIQFGLTPAEASLAAALASGHSLAEHAEANAVSKNTVRTHLRAPRKTSACPPLVKLHRPDPCCSLSR